MTGKELLLAALDNNETTRPAWVPFVGVHGGSLIGKNADEYLRSADLIVDGLLKADELYKPDGLPIVFDLQMEAEVLGCELEWADHGPPAVASHPLSMMDGGKSLADLSFDANGGRLPIAYEATRRLKQAIGDRVALYGLICGPYTLALHLLGNDIFLKMFDDAQGVIDVVKYCAEVGKAVAKEYIEAGCDVIAVVDPMVSQISPEHYNEFVAESLNDVFDYMRTLGGKSSLFVCGDATRNLEEMCKSTCDNLSIDENISLEYLRELGDKYDKSIGGNLKLTTVLLLGSPSDSVQDALRCMDACGRKGFILAPGCDLPYAVPAANLEAIAEIVHDEFKLRTARAQKTAVEQKDSFDDIIIPDYAAAENVIIDCVTLDSATCAPCQYMVEAVKKAVAAIGDGVEWHEHKVTGRDGLGYMTKLGVQHIPTICINGEVAFSSIIPDMESLKNAIEARALKI